MLGGLPFDILDPNTLSELCDESLPTVNRQLTLENQPFSLQTGHSWSVPTSLQGLGLT